MANPERSSGEKKESKISLKTITYAEMVGGVGLMLVSGPVGLGLGLAFFASGALEYYLITRGKDKKQGSTPQAA
jgi:hypothetical protein